MPNEYSLYGAPMSLYTGKARAYLIFKNLPYNEVFSSLKVYKSIIIPNTGVRFVPVLKTPEDEYLQDTAIIIDTLEQRHPERSVTPQSAKQKLVSYLFETWADEWLVIHDSRPPRSGERVGAAAGVDRLNKRMNPIR